MLDATSGRECDPLAVDRNETTGKRDYTNEFPFMSIYGLQYSITTYSNSSYLNSRRKI